MASTGKYKAVVFDLGGVVVKLNEPEMVRKLVAHADGDAQSEYAKALLEFETGVISLLEFKEVVRKAIGGFTPQTNAKLDNVKNGASDDFISKFVGEMDEHIDAAIKAIKRHGLKTALLTNNFFLTPDKVDSMILKDLTGFDIVVESCRVGIRKPDPAIYKLTAEKLDVKPEECIFLDDFPKNCEGAEAAGMAAIQVHHGESQAAVEKLQELLGLKLV